jgi:hypothetical protein
MLLFRIIYYILKWWLAPEASWHWARSLLRHHIYWELYTYLVEQWRLWWVELVPTLRQCLRPIGATWLRLVLEPKAILFYHSCQQLYLTWVWIHYFWSDWPVRRRLHLGHYPVFNWEKSGWWCGNRGWRHKCTWRLAYVWSGWSLRYHWMKT